MSDLRRLKKLYRQIPTFQCIEGCTDCCGPVPFSRLEWDQIGDKRIATTLDCPYANNGCDIYEQRPLICRIFGASNEKRLQCPHGCRPENPLSTRQTSLLMKRYLDLERDRKAVAMIRALPGT